MNRIINRSLAVLLCIPTFGVQANVGPLVYSDALSLDWQPPTPEEIKQQEDAGKGTLERYWDEAKARTGKAWQDLTGQQDQVTPTPPDWPISLGRQETEVKVDWNSARAYHGKYSLMVTYNNSGLSRFMDKDFTLDPDAPGFHTEGYAVLKLAVFNTTKGNDIFVSADNGNDITGKISLAYRVGEGPLPVGEWREVTIPLAELGVPSGTIESLLFKATDPHAVVHFDEIRFEQGEAVGTTPPGGIAAPAMAASDILVGGYVGANWVWPGDIVVGAQWFLANGPVHDGHSRSIGLSFSAGLLGQGTFYITSKQPFDSSSYTHLDITLYRLDAAGKLSAYINANDGGSTAAATDIGPGSLAAAVAANFAKLALPAVDLDKYVSGGTFPLRQWVTVSIPLADLNTQGKTLTGIGLRGENMTTPVYIDSIRIAQHSSGSLSLSEGHPFQNPDSYFFKRRLFQDQEPTSNFATLEVFPGVTLDLPRDWIMADPQEIQQSASAAEAIHGQSVRVEDVKKFQPPVNAPEVSVVVMLQPKRLSQEELRTADDTFLQKFADGMYPSARQGLEALGYQLQPLSNPGKTMVGDLLGFAVSAQAVAHDGSSISIDYLIVPTETREVWLAVGYGSSAPVLYKPILERAKSTLRVKA